METTTWKRGSPGGWSSVAKRQGGDAARLDIRPPAERPINLRTQSIRQTADWRWLTQGGEGDLEPTRHMDSI